MTNFILATAGHVDHGKSSLVKALTGTDPDRLPEEKARGITIDLGFAHLALQAPPSTLNPHPSTFSVGIVDVPGHEDFVRNMIAGVGSIDLALLAVAADDGWMPQTEEHLQILEYLGVRHIVVALTKIDIGAADRVETDIRERLRGTPFANAPLIRTSLRGNLAVSDSQVFETGIAALKDAIASELSQLAAPRDIGKPRLFVDRAFTLRGIGTVVTGTLTGGTLRAGDNVFVQPRNASVRIRSIQTHGRNVDVALPGMRTAVNLPDVAIGTDIQRGHVVTTQPVEPITAVDVFLTRSPRLQHNIPIKSGASAYVHHGTTRALAKIILLNQKSLAAGESGFAQMRLSAPSLAFVGDRFVVRAASEQHTIAGGVILNVNPKPDESSEQRALVAARVANPDDVDLAVWIELARTGIVQPSKLLQRSRFSAAEIESVLQRLNKHGDIFLHGEVAAKMLTWRELRERAANIIDAAHKANPERRGLELNDLRAQLNPLSPAAFDALMVDLCANGFVRAGSTIARASHRAALPPQLQSAAEKIRAALANKPFDPPSRKDLAPDQHHQHALRFLIEQRQIVEIGDEIILLAESVDQMQRAVTEFISASGPATASQLREKLNTSRRVIVPVLEYFDRQGFTRRVGDERALAPKAAVVKLDDAEAAGRS